MRSARCATVALLGTVAVIAGGCHHARITTERGDDRAQVYVAALRQLQPDNARWMVIDSLIPATDIDVNLYDKMVAELDVSTAMLDAFMAVQRTVSDQRRAPIPAGRRFSPMRAADLDSMRLEVRQDITTGAAERGPNNDLFWRRWRAAFPGIEGYVMLSPAIVSSDGRQALVQVRVVCGPTCGKAELRHYRREGRGDWRPALTVILSES